MTFSIRKTVFILSILAIVLNFTLYVISKESEDKLRIAYITDLNLFPTPIASQHEKHLEEKKSGLLIYESQSILQDIIKYLNFKQNYDVVIFGGNNIYLDASEQVNSSLNIMHLFLDIVSEINSDIFFIFGNNDQKICRREELVNALNLIGVHTDNLWWSVIKNNFLLIGLDSELFFNNSPHMQIHLKWLKDVLSINSKLPTVIFMHEGIFAEDGAIIKNKNITKFLEILKQNPQVYLLVSGGEYLNRVKIVGNSVYVSSASPIAYPCSYKVIELSSDKIKIDTLNIGLKGVIKKAEKSLLESHRASNYSKNSPKSIKDYVVGDKSDRKFEISSEHLRNR